MWWFLLCACTALTGLEELDTLPAGFPLAIEAETGLITSPQGSDQVSVDVLFGTKEAARVGWTSLRAQAEAKGFAVVDESRKGKRDTVTLQGPGGKMELGCCRPRPDRFQLVFVTWWPAS